MSKTVITPDQDAVVCEVQITAPPDYGKGWPGVIDGLKRFADDQGG
jgi:hypothetical protein